MCVVWWYGGSLVFSDVRFLILKLSHDNFCVGLVPAFLKIMPTGIFRNLLYNATRKVRRSMQSIDLHSRFSDVGIFDGFEESRFTKKIARHGKMKQRLLEERRYDTLIEKTIEDFEKHNLSNNE